MSEKTIELKAINDYGKWYHLIGAKFSESELEKYRPMMNHFNIHEYKAGDEVLTPNDGDFTREQIFDLLDSGMAEFAKLGETND